MASNQKEMPVFSFVFGRGHGPECWDFVRPKLEQNGIASIAPDFPIEDSGASLDDHAEILAQAENKWGESEFVRVGWSWGANIVARAVSASTRRIIFVAPGFHPMTVFRHPNRELIHTDHGMIYSMFQAHQNDEERLSFAEMAFYHDVKEKSVVEDAVKSLRPHPYRENEPVLDVFPAVPLGYIALLKDRAITYDSQYRTAHALGVKPRTIRSGHAPMYSRPNDLANLLIELSADGTTETN